MCGLLDQLLGTLSDFLPVQFTARDRCTAGEGRPSRRPQGAGHSPGSDSTRSPTVSPPSLPRPYVSGDAVRPQAASQKRVTPPGPASRPPVSRRCRHVPRAPARRPRPAPARLRTRGPLLASRPVHASHARHAPSRTRRPRPTASGRCCRLSAELRPRASVIRSRGPTAL